MNCFFLIFILAIQIQLFGQDKVIENQLHFPVHQEAYPTYPGCNIISKKHELKKCFEEKTQTLIGDNFNVTLAKSLGLPDGLIKITTSIKIDTLGNVTDIKVNAPHDKLTEEAMRVIKLIPQMEQPATYRNKPKTIIQTIPIFFMLKN